MEPVRLPMMGRIPARAQVPTILHQVWVGDHPPQWVRRMWEDWDRHLPEGWTTRRWTNVTTRLSPVTRNLMPTIEHLPYRMQADLLRVWVTYHEGGVYADSDTVPLAPADSFAPYAPHRDWVMTDPSEKDSTVVLRNAFFGMRRYSPNLRRVWEYGTVQLARGIRTDHFVMGPRAFRRAMDPATCDIRYGMEYTRGPWVKEIIENGHVDRQKAREQLPDCDVLSVRIGVDSWEGGRDL